MKAFRDMPVEAFSGFDAVINFAAIVHRPEVKDQELYDDVNYRMACLLAQKAKQAGKTSRKRFRQNRYRV